MIAPRYIAPYLAASGLLIGVFVSEASAEVVLASHRAVYEMTLEGRKGIEDESSSLHGRMVYEFTGSACAGYKVSFRFVLRADSADGETSTTDTRSTNFEDAAGTLFRFTTETYTNGVKTEDTVGAATLRDGGVDVRLSKPEAGLARFEGQGEIVFPTAHLRRIIEAAERGDHLLAIGAYDGSEGGHRLFDSATVIGEERTTPPEGAEAGIGQLRRWPVTVSYFLAGKGGDKTPDYAMGFDLWENGVSSRLRLDYGDFALSGNLQGYEALPDEPCPAATEPTPPASPSTRPNAPEGNGSGN